MKSSAFYAVTPSLVEIVIRQEMGLLCDAPSRTSQVLVCGLKVLKVRFLFCLIRERGMRVMIVCFDLVECYFLGCRSSRTLEELFGI